MSKVAILICSCDYYSDCWKPIICSFNKYWPDCEYDKLIVSNHKDEDIPGVRIIKVGDHKGWASDTLKAVEMTDYDYYIYFQEDYWLNKPVDNDAIMMHIAHCEENGVEYLKIEPDRPKCDQYRIGDSNYCKNPLDKKYTINSAVAVWSRGLFKKVCVPGWTGWDFEYKIIGYLKANHIVVNSEVLHSSVIYPKGITMIPANGIQRGRWTPAGVAFLKENGFEELLLTRKTQNKFYAWCYKNLPSKGILHYPKMAFLRFLRYIKVN